MAIVTLNDKINAGFARVIDLLKQVRDDNAGKIGTLSNLNTVAKGSLVLAINELASDLANLSQIDDTGTSATSSWSSQKTAAQIAAAVTALINGADGSQDTLAEIAAQVTALAQADNGLVGVVAQVFTAAEQAIARSNIGAASAADIGDVQSADFVSVINSAFAAA